jgi:hypothetical protein
VYPNVVGGYDYESLSTKLSEIKESYPDKTDAAILLEPEIPYDTLVQIMDLVRVAVSVDDERVVRNDLFPDISIGDAPILDGA